MAKRGRKAAKHAPASRRTRAIPKKKPTTSKAAKAKPASRAPKPKSATSKPEITRLKRELRLARDRQAATSEILRVINQSPADVQPVFDAIVLAAVRLIHCDLAFFMRCEATTYAVTAHATPSGLQTIRRPPEPIDPKVNFPARAIVTKRTLHLPDWSRVELPDYERRVQDTFGVKSSLYLPVLHNESCIGLLTLASKRTNGFGEDDIALAEAFRDQALTAIENTRAFNETREALERQTATADILKVIAASPSDVQPVFDAIVTNAKRLIGGFSAGVYRFVDGVAHLAAITSTNPVGDEVLRATFPRPMAGVWHFQTVLSGEVSQIADTDDQPDAPLKEVARARGYRSALHVPLKGNDGAIGMLSVTRENPGPFATHHIELLQTFADQAVIAIENVRLFNETQEALERQTATADILKVIASSPSDVQPAFDAIVANADRLVGGFSTNVYRFVDSICHLEAFTPVNPIADEMLKARFPLPVADFPHFELVHTGETVEITDTEADPDRALKEIARARGSRSLLYTPLKSKGTVIGLIAVSRRNPGPFTAHHVELLKTFADQAVIAIENVRLFNETQEALERQTATADILKVIASSPSDVQPVFDAIAARSKRLVDARSTAVHHIVDGVMHLAAFTPISPEADATLQAMFPAPLSNFSWAESIRNGQVYCVTDTEDGPEQLREMARKRGWRSCLCIPLLRDGKPIGMIAPTRAEPGPFAERDIQLLQTFADQAVIAIENVRLFNETKEALERQTATADILKVIASSPSDVQPVFDAIAASANRLIGGLSAVVYRFVDGVGHLAAFTPVSPVADAALRASFPRPISDVYFFKSAQAGKVVQVSDTEAHDNEPQKQLARARGFRSVLFAPLMSKGATIGVIATNRTNPGPFSAHHVQLLQTFADQAVIAIENVRLFNETKEALERQTATADILKVIASSPSDVQPVFEAIVANAVRLSNGLSAGVYRFVDDNVHLGAFTSMNPVADEALRASFPRPIADLDHFRIARQTGKAFPIPDTEDQSNARLKELARARGFRSLLHVPLGIGATSIGTIAISRKNPGPFSAHHVELLQTFADQAVIAIENVRLFNETKEALERQTATADILKVIASSPSDVRPVFDAIVANADRLVGGLSTGVYRFSDDQVHLEAFTPRNPAADEMLRGLFPRPIAGIAHFAKAQAGEIVEIADTEIYSPDPQLRDLARAREFRSLLSLPMTSKGSPIGVIVVSRRNPSSFSAHQVQLLQTFADQAVIAIENVRLFNETQEALERQTATADILKVIASSPSDVQPVFEAIAERSNRLMDGLSTAVYSIADDTIHLMAFTRTSPEADAALQATFPRPVSELSWAVQARKGGVVEIPDAEAEWGELTEVLKMVRMRGFRSVLFVPLLRDGITVGVIGVTRKELGRFAPHHVQLLQTFADQAVIAIGNVQLFDEVQAKTRDLAESLEQQTATSEVLEVISSSPGELDSVFQKMLENACRVCEANFGFMQLWDGESFRSPAAYNVPPSLAVLRMDVPVRPHPLSALYTALQTRRVVHRPDVRESPAYRAGVRHVIEIADVGGARTLVIVPMLKEDQFIGSITMYRQEVRPFTDKQIALVENFTKQAVIAIENTRLLKELRARTDDLSESLQQQTATADVLKAISRSPGKIEPVFDKILESARQLCGAKFGHLLLFDGETWRAEALHNLPETYANFWRTTAVVAGPETNLGRVQRTSRPDQVQDVRLGSGYQSRSPLGVATVELGGARTLLTVPLLKEGNVIGGIAFYRTEVRPFTEKQVELLSSFADQAVIAIENVRLFNETQEALARQTATSDILRVISQSPTDVQPVFDAIVLAAVRLLRCDGSFILRCDGATFAAVAAAGPEGPYRVFDPKPRPIDPDADFPSRAIATRKNLHLPDWSLIELPEFERQIQETRGYNCALFLPLLRGDECIGVIGLASKRPNNFSEDGIALAESFRDQALIAIENARLFNETQEALEQQTATSEVLAVISRSPSDLNPVLEAISDTAARLCGSEQTMFFRYDGAVFRILASWNFPPEVHEMLERRPLMPGHPSAIGRAGASLKPVCIPDVLADPDYGLTGEQSRARYRATLAVPLLREGRLIGALSLNRSEPGAFTGKQIELVTTFADQAVIAIENVRLFDEVQAKTKDLTEALAYQTGSSNVLRVIASSPTDVDPVLKAIVESARELCEANDAVALLKDGEALRFSAHSGPIAVTLDKWPISRNWTAGRAFVDQKPVHVRDMLSEEGAEFPDARVMGLSTGSTIHTVLSVPLLRGNESIGAILLRRTEVRPFTEKQVDLLSTFADQAVIAIQNARMFNETQEALERQTATADILKVIASSPSDVQPVFEAIAERSNRLMNGLTTAVYSIADETIHLMAFTRTSPEADAALRASFPRPLSEAPPWFHQILRGEIVENANAEIEYAEDPALREVMRLRGVRSLLFVPLLRDGTAIGIISVTRGETGTFAPHHVQLLQTFADQAVIAIGNVRLFDEVQQRTRELAASLDDLRTAQDRLVQTEKLASLGQLTAGIAHEIKNPLNFVNNFSALSAELTDELNDVLRPAALEEKMRLEVDELTKLLKDNLEKVVQHGKRADSIVKNMLLHSREGSGEQRPTDINALLDESLNLAYHGARAEKPGFNITLQRDFDKGAGEVEAFPQEITRAFLNLISNGFYAATKRMADNGAADFEPLLSAATKNLGGHVEIRIRDNGTGIPPEVKEKMFNPFFTTKPAGEGTGLGLSMSHDIIVKQHGGRIEVTTEPGRFTEFTIVLPRTIRR